MKIEWYTSRRGILVPLFILVMALPLSYSYFTWQNTREGTWRQMRDFYPRLRLHWFNLTGERLDQLLESGDMDRFQTYAIRAALARWRIQSIAPEAFPAIMRDYEEGLWRSATSEEWAQSFARIDSQWMENRRAAKQSSTADFRVGREPGKFAISFGPASTAEVGSLLWFVFEANPNEPIPHYARMIWRTSTQKNVADYRIRYLPMRPAERPGADGRISLVYEADMSWEPAWLTPAAKDVRITIEFPNAEAYEFVTVIGGNSPYLPVK